MNDAICIVGGGQAGLSIASKLRKLGELRPITIISSELYPPYQRPPLSKKYLLGDTKKERLFFRPSDWYQKNNVSLKLGATVKSINREDKTVQLETGENFAYQKLALTTGSSALKLPKKLGGLLPGVYSIKTLNDVDSIKHEFKAGRTMLVIGGGYIGLEAAATASKLGLNVVLVEKENRILNRVAAAATADYFRNLHLSKGVQILESTSLVNLIEKEGRLAGARLSSGETISVDFVICGIGIRPNDDLAEKAELKVSNGIKVNEYCQTSDKDIVAAGDCASFLYKDKLIRLESVQNAIDQGEIAAETIFGNKVSYQPYPWFWSDQFETKLQITGLNIGFNHTIVRKGRRLGAQSVWYYRDQSLIAVDAMNDGSTYLIASRLLKMQTNLTPEQADNINFDLKSLLK
jgi:3-phenylpropionate/trans-cinnamate dioxygenase ferredoxin reductase component